METIRRDKIWIQSNQYLNIRTFMRREKRIEEKTMKIPLIFFWVERGHWCQVGIIFWKTKHLDIVWWNLLIPRSNRKIYKTEPCTPKTNYPHRKENQTYVQRQALEESETIFPGPWEKELWGRIHSHPAWPFTCEGKRVPVGGPPTPLLCWQPNTVIKRVLLKLFKVLKSLKVLFTRNVTMSADRC